MSSGYKTQKRKSLNLISTLSISSVLFILGLVFIILFNSNRLISNLKDKITVFVYLKEYTNTKNIEIIKQHLEEIEYINQYKYFSKNDALEVWEEKGGEDFIKFLDTNILPAYFTISLKSEFFNSEYLNKLENDLLGNKYVSDIMYPEVLINKFSFINKAVYILLSIALFLLIISILLIDGTIRMYFYNNRFLIKTMLLVGASSSYIASPYIKRAVVNGFISGLISCITIFSLIEILQRQIPEIKLMDDTDMFSLFGILITIGVFISYFSTLKSIIKYLKKPNNKLY